MLRENIGPSHAKVWNSPRSPPWSTPAGNSRAASRQTLAPANDRSSTRVINARQISPQPTCATISLRKLFVGIPTPERSPQALSRKLLLNR